LSTNVIMPALGVAQQTGTLLKWLKAEGQSVSKGEPLMEIETDKATVEIEAPGSGVLANVTATPGDEVPVGNRIAVILGPGEAASVLALHDPHSSPLPKGEGTSESRAATHGKGPPSVPPLPEGEGRGEGRAAASRSHPTNKAEPSIALGQGRVLASPAAKRIAREKGVNLASVSGSGPEGSVLAEDVLRVAPGGTPVPTVGSTTEKIVPLSPMRRIVGERMTQSKQGAPHFYLNMDIDMSAVTKLRSEAKQQGEGNGPSINDFILHACAHALKDFPSLNASFSEAGIKLHADIHLGMAVALEEGLVVPVIRNADRLSLTELAARSRDLVDKAQKKKLFPLDYEGGTFSVSNLGMLGVDSFTAIINPPQCAILAVGRVAPRVVAEDGMFAIKPMMTATLSADHRVVDGAIGARFLQNVKTLLESFEA
jgi:pyruvate dehydrogenase E2 component (dihydrolipoamide acetyltransferase)